MSTASCSRPKQASEHLQKKHAIKLGVQRLADLRSAGGGPKFIKPTQREVRYPAAMLDEWAAARNHKPLLSFAPTRPADVLEKIQNRRGRAHADAQAVGETRKDHTAALK